MHRLGVVLIGVGLCVLLLGCSAPLSPVSTAASDRAPTLAWPSKAAPALKLPEGYHASLVVEGLDNPTQFAVSDDGWVWAAQLAGGETDGTGQIVAVSVASGEQRVLAEDLFKPTGLALLDKYLWVMAGSELWRAPITGEAAIGALEKVVTLPSTSRSSGTLTVLPDGRLLYVTSGPDDDDLNLGEGRLWAINPQRPTEPQLLGVGFAMPYAHTTDADNQMWVVNMTEDILAGEVPPDALFKLDLTADSAQPPCYYYDDPKVEYPNGKAPDTCGSTHQPVLFFPPHSTPTSIVVSPWEPNTLLVTFWIAGEVVRVPLGGAGATPTWDTFLSGMVNAQNLVVLPDESLLVSDFGQGKIYRIEKA